MSTVEAAEAALAHRFKTLAPTLSAAELGGLTDIALGRTARARRDTLPLAAALPTPRPTQPVIVTTPHGVLVATRIAAGDTLEKATRFADEIMGGGTSSPPAAPKVRDRETVARELDDLAAARAAADGVSRHEGYTRVLREPKGQALYVEHRSAPEPVRQPAPAPSGPPQSELDRRAEALAASEGIGLPKAYARIMGTPEGARLYREHRATMTRAVRG